jgi:hypothetical protein
MSKNAHYIGQPIFSQLLKFIPRQRLAVITKDLSSDYYIKSFRTYDHLVSMLYASFHNCRSLREVVTGMMACHGKLQHLGLSDYPKRSTLSDANRRRESAVFEALYFSIYKMYGSVLSDSHSKGKLDKRLFIVDSTTISLFQEVLKNAGRTPLNGKRKGGLKAHILLKADEDVPCLVRMTSAAANDILFLQKIHLPANSILVFDKGYNSYSDYERLTKENITWITRKNSSAAVEVKQNLEVTHQQKAQGVQKDQLIILGNTINRKQLRVSARLITYHDQNSGKVFEFITNNTKMKPSTIAQLYQRRWQVETLFKRLKQNNQLKYFLGDNENAIKIQIWCSLIADLITKIIQRKVKKPWSFANLSSMLRIHLMSYTGLYQFLENPEKNNFQKTTQQLNLFSSV